MRRRWTVAAALAALTAPVAAQRVSYPPDEFMERRQEVCAAIEEQATILLFAKTKADVGVRFRQDHDFFYLTGNEDSNGAVVIDAASCDSWLFLVTQTEREASRDGWNWLYQDGAAEEWGFREIRPMHYLEEFLARRRVSGTQVVYTRLSERDDMDGARGDARSSARTSPPTRRGSGSSCNACSGRRASATSATSSPSR